MYAKSAAFVLLLSVTSVIGGEQNPVSPAREPSFPEKKTGGEFAAGNQYGGDVVQG
jgi:hypothetical protein